jgi:pimeloyl-ACP methyl ester carboxylesterase
VWANVYDLFEPDFDQEHEWTHEEIFANQLEEDLYQAAGRFPSMGYRAKYLDELAGYLSKKQDEVFGYIFAWDGGGVPETEEFSKIFGAAHSMEIPFFFGAQDSLFGYSFIPENEAGRKDLQGAMQTYLYNFMTTGDPGLAPDGTPWDPWSSEEGAYKGVIFNADAQQADLQYITDSLSFEDVSAAMAAEIGSWPEGFRQAWGWLPASMTTQQPEAIRFSHMLDFQPTPGAVTHSGTYGYFVDQWSGYQIAGYQLEIPDGWSLETDGLVLYCHGYRGDTPYLSVSIPEGIRGLLTQMGYASAASSYGENGYNIATGVIGTKKLLDLISEKYGAIYPVYIIGHSMGGHITARSVTEYPDAYDGAMPMCGVVGGDIEQFSSSLDWTLLANYFSGLNFEMPFTAEEKEIFLGTVFGGAFGYLPPEPPSTYDNPAELLNLNEAGQKYKAATMYRTGGKRPLYDAAFANAAFFQNYLQGLDFAMDPTWGVGRGIAVDNMDRVFQLDDDPAISPEEQALNNGIERIASDGEFDFEDVMFPVHGNIEIPVLSLHAIGDFFVPFGHERIYAQKVADAGRSNLLRTRIIRSTEHCGFSGEETAEAFMALAAWVENGITPQGDDVLDPENIAEDDFGCRFTRQQRPADQYTNGDGEWICTGNQN